MWGRYSLFTLERRMDKQRQTYFHIMGKIERFPFREHPKQFNEIVHGFIQSLN